MLRELIATADVVVTGYRPGALERYGLLPDGVIVARLRAWDRRGPWADRRGFDSLVQAGCGIAAIEASPDGHPGALPAQALDHGTGYLLAAGVLRALTERQQSGRATLLRHSLAGTAQWLLGMDRETADGEPGTPTPRLAETPSPTACSATPAPDRLRRRSRHLGVRSDPLGQRLPCLDHRLLKLRHPAGPVLGALQVELPGVPRRPPAVGVDGRLVVGDARPGGVSRESATRRHSSSKSGPATGPICSGW